MLRSLAFLLIIGAVHGDVVAFEIVSDKTSQGASALGAGITGVCAPHPAPARTALSGH
tara:strand:+ start:121 stop:294 length:174 start_codon:yes stop_codon:yes gene_type:complete